MTGYERGIIEGLSPSHTRMGQGYINKLYYYMGSGTLCKTVFGKHSSFVMMIASQPFWNRGL